MFNTRMRKKVGVTRDVPTFNMGKDMKIYEISSLSFKIIKKILIIKFYINYTKYKLFLDLYNNDYIKFDKKNHQITFVYNGVLLNSDSNNCIKKNSIFRFTFNKDKITFYSIYNSILSIKNKYKNKYKK
jgi:hypothetical protein